MTPLPEPSQAAKLARWLKDHPDLFRQALDLLGTPVLPCEGHTGCTGVVLWPTLSQTQYEWDGVIGLDPNRHLMLCPFCSVEYTEQMGYQWEEYYAGLL